MSVLSFPTIVKIYFVIMFILAIFCVHRLFLVIQYIAYKNKNIKPLKKFRKLPFVTIQLPIYNEKYVVERLILSAVNIDYPKNRFEIQILDDSTDETKEIVEKLVTQYKSRGYNIYHITRDNREGFKAGALANGLKYAKGKFIAIFDADFIIPEKFIRETIHFFTNPKIGMVQTCWEYINREYSLLTKIQAMMLDGHFIVEHFARNRGGKFFNFNGTAGIWRKRAIIDSGGWEYDTLTEDLDLSYRAQLKGWKFVFLKHIKSFSELPVDINAFKQQQHRWTKGSVETFKKIFPVLLKEKLPFFIKIESLFHLGGNFAYLFLLCLAIVMYPSIVSRLQIGWYQLLFTDLPLFIFSFFSIYIFYYVAEKERGKLNIKTLLSIPILMAMGIGISINNSKAVLEAMFNIKSPFNRTPKLNIKSKKDKWFLKKYRVKTISLPALELVMAFYFVYIIQFSIKRENFFSLPFLLLFFTGFFYNSILGFYYNFRR